MAALKRSAEPHEDAAECSSGNASKGTFDMTRADAKVADAKVIDMTTWNARGWAIATAIGVFGVLAPAESHAACTGSDLAGTWKIYELLTGNVDSGWMTCTVKIGSGGGVKSGTSCTEKEAGSGSRFSSTIRGGTINLRSSCRITGNFKVGDCRHTIMDGSISDDGKKMSGVGKDCGGSGSLIIFNGIKR